MATGRVHELASCALALALASCGSASSDQQTADTRSGAGAGGPAYAASDAAQAYVAQFTKSDPATCFKEVELSQPRLKPRVAGFGRQVPPTRVIVMIDGSGSMAGRMGGRTKLAHAREAALAFIDGLPASVQTSLLVFGQQGDNSGAGKARSCSAIDVIAPMSPDRDRFRTALGQVRAVGWTPLAAGLDRAETLLADSSTPGEQIIYVVSDGEETCGGDPVAVARRMNSGRTRAIVNVIGFNLPRGEAAKLTAVARGGGGGFVNVSNEAELARFSAEVRESIRQTDNHVASTIAATDNEVATTIAITDAQTCTSNLATAEQVAMTNDITARQVAGRPLPFAAEAKALLKVRHASMQSRFEAFRARLKGAQATAERGIDASTNAVR